jgi:repressor of nif and glnA expression
MIPEEQLEGVCTAFDEVIRKRLGFFSSYHVVDQDPRIPAGSTGIMTICSITMDGVLQRRGVPVRMAYGGRLAIEGGKPFQFLDLIGYRGTTIDPLQLFISAGLTSISTMMETSSGTVLANVREVPVAAGPQVQELSAQMRSCGFEYPVSMGTSLFNLRPDPYRLSIVAFSGMNFVGNAVERGYRITTEIGAGNISFSRITDTNR